MARLFTKFSMLVVIAFVLQMEGLNGCLEEERIALLEIKSSFINSSFDTNATRYLQSWVYDRVSNCCIWDLVECNATTGRVINLSLSSLFDYGKSTILNFSLFQPFEELQSLDLSSNYFRGWVDSRGGGLENLRNLILLDLSNNRMSGSLQKLGLMNMTNLEFLDLRYNSISGSLQESGICKLKNIQELDISENNITGPLPACLNNLTNIQALSLSSNQLSGSLPSIIANLTMIEYLSLGENNFEGLFSFNLLASLSKLEIFLLSTRSSTLQVRESENFLQPPNQLRILQLRNCNLHSIPSFIMFQHSLESIDLSHNKLVGPFPTWLLHNNTSLQFLILENNFLTGILQLPNSTYGLLKLSVSNNNLNGQFPNNLSIILPELLDLELSCNSFEGHIPSSIDRMEKLIRLDLSSNNFSGHILRSFVSGSSSLLSLNLSHNNFRGEILPEFMNMTQLQFLDLGNNFFSGKIQDRPSKAGLLHFLNLSNNRFSGQIPHWIGNLSSLKIISMSNNLLEGGVPIQLGNIKNLRYLDVSKNKLSGSLASSFNLSSMRHLYMQKNAFSGSIPNAFFKSSALSTLDLRDNDFSGSIPNQIDNELLNLHFLLLGGNNLEGHIPHELCRLKNLSILDLSHNKLNGTIPSCFINMLSWVAEAQYSWSDNEDFGVVASKVFSFVSSKYILIAYQDPVFTSSYQKLKVGFVTKNREESYEGSILRYMVGLDLSGNELTGDIPIELGYLLNIHALNLSHNFLSGSIPESFRNLKNIESLDLSNNKLNGKIPSQLIELHNLAIFNVSFNNLSGLVPDKEQFATFEESNYRGNPGLCGSQIKTSCSSEPTIPPATPSNAQEEDDDHAIDMLSFYWSLLASYITTILALLLIFYLNPNWRRQWFWFIDECIISCYCWILKNVFCR